MTWRSRIDPDVVRLATLVLAVLASVVALVALSQRMWWAFGAAAVITLALVGGFIRHTARGEPGAAHRSWTRSAMQVLLCWTWGLTAGLPMAVPRAGQPYRGVAEVVLVLAGAVVLTLSVAAMERWRGRHLPLSPEPSTPPPAAHLTRGRRQELARALCRGTPLDPNQDHDVRAMIVWVLDREIVGWLVLAVAVVLAAVGVLMVPGGAGVGFVVGALVAAVVAWRVLALVSAARRRQHQMSLHGRGAA